MLIYIVPKFTTFDHQNAGVELVFATHNKHKVREVEAMLPEGYTLKSLDDVGFHKDIPETADTLEGNALLKAQAVFDATQLPSFADDTGLFIPALNGAPGVLSARFAGSPPDAGANMQKVLTELSASAKRDAYFLTVIALVNNEDIYYFHGKIAGEILQEPRGTGGFGYDPIFVPKGYDLSFAELAAEIKNEISHRALAFNSLIDFLSRT
ncbi:MAG: RdgB/HAM1 family non-canonical purine NTP pyrophosphatase [Flavobacteriaceae bacterium]|nr:RdgB/HAM1 family non-canonical purine NTP pyrophosphatase [Flavobacteriaceae bacterium]